VSNLSNITVICGTDDPLLVNLAFIQIHTHMPIHTNVKNFMYMRSA
jgi:hypothetical protein